MLETTNKQGRKIERKEGPFAAVCVCLFNINERVVDSTEGIGAGKNLGDTRAHSV